MVANGDVKTLLDMDQTGMAYFHYFSNMEVDNNERVHVSENGSVKPTVSSVKVRPLSVRHRV